MKNGVFKIKDLNSKFGTLLKLTDDVVLNIVKNKKFIIQKLNTVYHYELKLQYT